WPLAGTPRGPRRPCRGPRRSIEGGGPPGALSAPPIDSGMLGKAAAAGLDLSSIVSGLTQPIGPVRCAIMIQKALELCAEVRGLGNSLLSAIEKGDAEHLALIRQRQEIQIQQMAQDVRFLQWKSAQEATTSLLTSRATALERLHYYQGLLGLPADPNAPDDLGLDEWAKPEDPPKLTEENFDDVYGALVTRYDKTLTLQTIPGPDLANDNGNFYLNRKEDAELNEDSPAARSLRSAAMVIDGISSGLSLI